MRLSCLARNGRSPGEESRSDALAAQAIEAQPVSGQIRPSRGKVRRGPNSSGREGVAKTGSRCIRRWRLGQAKGACRLREGWIRCRKPHRRNAQHPVFRGRPLIGRQGLGHRQAGFAVSRQNARPARLIVVNLSGNEVARLNSLVSQRSEPVVACPAHYPGRAGIGPANPVNRAQAVQPITTPPIPAKASRHASEEMPISDKPSTA